MLFLEQFIHSKNYKMADIGAYFSALRIVPSNTPFLLISGPSLGLISPDPVEPPLVNSLAQ